MSNYPTAAGPTWGLYQADVGAANARADRNADAAAKWKAHAEQMKADLDQVWEMFRNRAAAEDAQAELKRQALNEIEKFDPMNKMLNSGYRQKVYDEAYQRSLSEQKKKN
jgi:hypothetical protein